MDRGRSFRFLGISETATKAQVEAAYQRKVARYKGPDYAEEPAYAERKLAQLYQAFQEAYELAENSSATVEPTRAARVERDAGPRADDEHNAREKFHQWMERRDDDKHQRKTKRAGKRELPKLSKPDLSKLKEKLHEIKEEVATQLELNSGEETTKAEYEVTEQVGEQTVFADTYDDDQDDRYQPSTTTRESDNKTGEILKVVVSLLTAIFLFAGGCGDSDIDFDDTDYENEPKYAYIYSSDWDIMTDEDEQIATKAGRSYDLLLEGTCYSSSTIHDETENDYREEADLFAKTYFNMDSIDAVTSHLFETFPSFGIDTEQPLSIQLDAIFAFYGFGELESAVWYENPYTQDRMCGYNDYLKYLNQYYDM